MLIKLDEPLPRKDWYQLPDGRWASREWTLESRKEAEAARVKISASSLTKDEALEAHRIIKTGKAD